MTLKVDEPPTEASADPPEEVDVDEATTKSAPADEPAMDAISRRTKMVAALLAVLTLVLVTALVALWLRAQDNTEQDRQRRAALELAEQQAVTLVTVNPANVNEQMRELLANSTGDFQRQFDAASPTFERVIKDGKVDSTATVEESGVVRISEDQARVLVALNSKVHNTETNTDEPRRYRLRVDLVKEGDRWLVSNMAFVP